MKNILLFHVSPRQKGTSYVLLQMCMEYLSEKGHICELMHLYPNLNNPEKIRETVNRADTLVFSGPCYINTYPADTIALLEDLSVHREVLHGQNIYGIIQGGMPYPHTHESGLSMLEMFCKKCDLAYKGGFVMGLGAMLNGQPIKKLPNSKKINRQLQIFFEHIDKEEDSPRQVYQVAQFKVPSLVYRIMSSTMNRKIDNDLTNHGIDVKQRSPYFISE
ncbi:NAD(P)H-dependent oxidoreductase [Lachnoclostridium sp.]|uniref:NAD(P)H-dependent oxidoreductase n=1 Tax=Lachnoclostridium sp. TaxID=2028282 RepID=UPI0028977840|nr:NAD(P)H-dependent oxidoreductase [Lachnoclostridium sp.]